MPRLPNVLMHHLAICETDSIGERTTVGAFSRLHAGASVGPDCVIGDHVVIERNATLGARVRIDAAAFIGATTEIEHDVHVGPGATIGSAAGSGLPTRIGSGAVIGANATIADHIEVGAYACIEPASVVTRNVPPRAIVRGALAQITGYVGAEHPGRKTPMQASQTAKAAPLANVRRVTLHEFPAIADMRGSLTVGNFKEGEVPFTPQRYFLVHAVPGREIRGEHAHRECQQFLICVHGSCAVVVDDGQAVEEVELTTPSRGLYLPPMTWGVQYKFTSDAALLVFASLPYDPADYIRDYETFCKEARSAHLTATQKPT